MYVSVVDRELHALLNLHEMVRIVVCDGSMFLSIKLVAFAVRKCEEEVLLIVEDEV